MKPYDQWNSTDIAQHCAHHIPAVDYVRADFERGTLARITERPSLWRRIIRRIFG